MKAEIEVNVGNDGLPILKIRHHDKSNELEQRLLGQFIQLGRLNGIKIVGVSGFLNSSKSESWENYEIITQPLKV